MFKLFLKKKFSVKKISNINLNFGPQHPAAHGVLRLLLKLDCERIVDCDPHIGLLHRGTESLVIKKPYYLSLPYFDRLDYVSMLAQEHGYCLSIENLIPSKYITLVVQKTRVMLDELTRILNHLLALACHALDVGSMSPIFWSFEERESIMEIYENISGARMHAAFYRPMIANRSLDSLVLKKINIFCRKINYSLNEVSSILTLNKIWKSRLISVGVLTLKDLTSFGLTGVFSRSIGVKLDFRLNKHLRYSFYRYLNINSYVTYSGDSYDRYIIRIYEMLESSNIILTTIFSYKKEINMTCVDMYMESTISKFKLWGGCTNLMDKQSSAIIESPKGAYSVSILGDSTNTPKHCKVRSPSYNNLLWLKYSAKGMLLADLITLIGTVDIVFGEIDR